MAKLDPERLAAWTSLRLVHDHVQHQLATALMAERGMPLPWYDVLEALRLARGKVRATELAQRVRITPSTLTRQLDRLEAEDLIAREHGREDARVVLVSITPVGREALRKASVTASRVVAKSFVVDLSDAQFAALNAIAERLPD